MYLGDSGEDFSQKMRHHSAISLQDWDGAWIVQVSTNDNMRVIQKAEEIVELYNNHTSYLRGFSTRHAVREQHEPLRVISSIEDKHGGANIVVLSGLSYDEVSQIPNILYIEPDAQAYITEYTWGLDRIDQASLPLDNIYETTDFKGCGVDVYVLDTGLDTAHQEFERTDEYPNRIVSNIWNSYGDAAAENTDGNGHGTHCTGNVGGNTVGVAPCANLYGMKVLSDSGSGSFSDIIAALQEVKEIHLAKIENGENPMSVVSMSLGGYCGSSCAYDLLNTKVQELYEIGVISAVAAGNSNADSVQYTPASAENALTVGASTIGDAKASFSNYGSLVDIMAPGVSILSACSSLASCSNGGTQLWWTISGTSMATPHVAGAVALQMEKGVSLYDLRMDAAAGCDVIRASLLCDATPENTVSGNPVGTTSRLLQIPRADGKWGCEVRETRAPTFIPTGPSMAPSAPPTLEPSATNAPTSSAAPTVYSIPDVLPEYSATNTNSARQNTVDEVLYVCPDVILTMGVCDGDGAFTGDTYIRLYDERTGFNIASNDDACGLGSRLSYDFTEKSECGNYRLSQGCYGSSTCTGTVFVQKEWMGETIPPSVSPVEFPVEMPVETPIIYPTGQPSSAPSVQPSGAPSGTPSVQPSESEQEYYDLPELFSPFETTNTRSATQNTVDESFMVCSNEFLEIGVCDESLGGYFSRDVFLRLYDEDGTELIVNDDACGLGSSFQFDFHGGERRRVCRRVTLSQGCYGDKGCSGRVTVRRLRTEIPSEIPSEAPSALPSETPTVNPTEVPTEIPSEAPSALPTERPSVIPTEIPSEVPTEDPSAGPTSYPTIGIPRECTSFHSANTHSATRNTAICSLFACEGTSVVMRTCTENGKECNGDTFLRLKDENGIEVAMNDDGCGYCSHLEYTFPRDSGCKEYELHQGCYDTEECEGQVKIDIL